MEAYDVDTEDEQYRADIYDCDTEDEDRHTDS